MSPIEIIWELVSSELGDSDFWPPIAVGAVIVFALFWLLSKIKRWQYRVGAITLAIGLIVAECNLLLEWHCAFLYLLAGLLPVLPALCIFVPFLWNQYRFYRIKKLCKQQSYVEALELLNAVKPMWLTVKQLRNYQKRRFFCLLIWGAYGKQECILKRYVKERVLFIILRFTFWHFV